MSEPIRVSRGLWRPRDAVDDLVGQGAALLTVAPEASAIGGATAGRIHGLWLPDGVGERVELCLRRDAPVPKSHSHSKRPEFRGRRRRLAPDEVVVIDGVPVATAARAWVDLGETLSLPDLVAAGDSLLRLGTDRAEIERVMSRAAHRRGIVRVRAAFPLLDERSRSRPESHLRCAVMRAGLPPSGVNEPIYDAHGQWLAEPDLSYDDVRLALEYNGALHADVDRTRRDITRVIDLGHRGGWRTVTFGPAEVFRRPDQLVAYVRQLRREQAHLIRATQHPVEWRLWS